jgi:hypothetical protein
MDASYLWHTCDWGLTLGPRGMTEVWTQLSHWLGLTWQKVWPTSTLSSQLGTSGNCSLRYSNNNNNNKFPLLWLATRRLNNYRVKALQGHAGQPCELVIMKCICTMIVVMRYNDSSLLSHPSELMAITHTPFSGSWDPYNAGCHQALNNSEVAGANYFSTQRQSLTCLDRESNPGLWRGSLACYHSTTPCYHSTTSSLLSYFPWPNHG